MKTITLTDREWLSLQCGLSTVSHYLDRRLNVDHLRASIDPPPTVALIDRKRALRRTEKAVEAFYKLRARIDGERIEPTTRQQRRAEEADMY